MTKARRRTKCPSPRISEKFPERLKARVLQDLQGSHPQAVALLNKCAYAQGNTTAIPQSMENQNTRGLMAACRLVGELTRKYRRPVSLDECKTAAIKSFEDSEAVCSTFNRKNWQRIDQSSDWFRYAKYFIRSTIGSLLPSEEALMSSARHGPGTSVGTKYKFSHPYFKYGNWPYTVTTKALKPARALIENDRRWLGSLEDSYRRRFHIPMWKILDWETFWSRVFEIVPGNRVTTVPKDSSKDRTIAIEPTMNVMLQLGVDGFIRKRLKRWGIDLDDQQHNCMLAHRGSIDGSIATLDLSAASDSVSLRICKLLLPHCWFEHLCNLRSPQGMLPGGKTLRFSKISSMGNGYTFALESLIFAAITYACARCSKIKWDYDNFAIYGDDIICPTDLVMRLVSRLELCGFAVNSEKSFFTGKFRESCGADWYEGQYVRAVYMKEPVTDVTELFHLHNMLYRWGILTHGYNVLASATRYITSIIPANVRLLGPIDDDDTSSYLFDPNWRPSFTRSGNVKPFRRIVKVSKSWRPKRPAKIEWFWGRMLAAHRPSRLRKAKFSIPFRYRGLLFFADVPSIFGRHDQTSGSSYEVTLRDQCKLQWTNGLRLTPGHFGRTVEAIAKCNNSSMSRRIHKK